MIELDVVPEPLYVEQDVAVVGSAVEHKYIQPPDGHPGVVWEDEQPDTTNVPGNTLGTADA